LPATGGLGVKLEMMPMREAASWTAHDRSGAMGLAILANHSLTALLENVRRPTPQRVSGLDVFEHEPRIHPALLALDNVVLSPHLASAGDATRVAMAELAIDNVRRRLTEESLPRNIITASRKMPIW
jgi:hypothetical protein